MKQQQKVYMGSVRLLVLFFNEIMKWQLEKLCRIFTIMYTFKEV